LCEKGIARQDGKNRLLLRTPEPADYFSIEEIDSSKADIVEKQIINKLSSYSLSPGDRFSELELSKELSTNTVLVREALSRIARSGIIKKHPRQKWEVVEFSSDMINEIADTRTLYEGYSIEKLKLISKNDQVWGKLRSLIDKHLTLLNRKKVKASDLRDIERSFHTTLIQSTNNRFIEESYEALFTLIFFHLGQIEYDYVKIQKVLKQHLDILYALLDRDFEKAKMQMVTHLEHAKVSMKNVNNILEKEKAADLVSASQ
jgi:DNA-binding GntR family transcriptional regulator